MFKIIRTIWEIIRSVLSIILVLLLAIIITQRVTNNKMAVLGIRIFNVATESMVPEYKVGDTILVKYTDPNNIKIGDDVTYLGMEESFKDRIVTHRVINIEKGENGLLVFQTKGIANEKEDPKINETQIYGKVIYKIKSITYINSVIGNLYGMYFAIIVPFALITFIEYVISQKYDEDEENAKKDKKDDINNKENNENIEFTKNKIKETDDNKVKNDINKETVKKLKQKEKRKKRREKWNKNHKE